MAPSPPARRSRRAVFSCCWLPLLVTLGAACGPTAPVTDVAIAPGLATFADTDAGYAFDYPANSFTITSYFSVTGSGAWMLKGRHQSWWLDVVTDEVPAADFALAAALRTRDADGPDGGRAAQLSDTLTPVANVYGLPAHTGFFTEVSRHWDEHGQETTETGSLGPVYLVRLSPDSRHQRALILVPEPLDNPSGHPEEIPEIVRTIRALPPGLTGTGGR